MNLNIEQLTGQVGQIIAKLDAIQTWKGNYPPSTEHFPQDSIQCSAGIDAGEMRGWVAFQFEDGGAHEVKAAFRLDEPGTSGGADVVTFDGAEVADDDFILSSRTGMEGFGKFYTRVVAEFKFTLNGEKKHLRFDGPV